LRSGAAYQSIAPELFLEPLPLTLVLSLSVLVLPTLNEARLRMPLTAHVAGQPLSSPQL
jgi:hypothetical protein